MHNFTYFIVLAGTYKDGSYFEDEDDYFIDNDSSTATYDESSDVENGKEYWDVQIEDVLKDFDSDHDLNNKDVHKSHNNIVQLMLIFLLLWRSFYNIPATALNHLIKFLYYVFSLLAPNSSEDQVF